MRELEAFGGLVRLPAVKRHPSADLATQPDPISIVGNPHAGHIYSENQRRITSGLVLASAADNSL